jgi:cystathionine beta-lyase/cystathionine gamma-synthase
MSNRRFPTIAARGVRLPFGAAPPLGGAIHQSTVGIHPDIDTSIDILAGATPGYSYYRFGHHNGDELDATVAALEGAESAVSGASGMAVITASLLATAAPGDHVIIDANCYGGTRVTAERDLTRMGIEVSFVTLTDLDAVRAAITPATTTLFAEVVSNPTMRVPDLDALCAIAHDAGATSVVDATFVSPAVIRPITHGADLVLHSIPKYLGGHSVAMGGVVAGCAERIDPIAGYILRSGSTLGPFDAWLAHLGCKTLALRMTAHSANATAVAARLDGHDALTVVHHPSLAGHPDHDVAARLMPGGTGGMLSFVVRGGLDAAKAFTASIGAEIPLAPSLGDVATTISHPASSSHRNVASDVRAALGIDDGLLRLSVGIEDSDDLLDTLTTALDAMA